MPALDQRALPDQPSLTVHQLKPLRPAVDVDGDFRHELDIFFFSDGSGNVLQ